MDKFLSLLVSGGVTGVIFSILAMGLVLTYATTGIFNFAHGAIAFVTAYVYYELHADNLLDASYTDLADSIVRDDHDETLRRHRKIMQRSDKKLRIARRTAVAVRRNTVAFALTIEGDAETHARSLRRARDRAH